MHFHLIASDIQLMSRNITSSLHLSILLLLLLVLLYFSVINTFDNIKYANMYLFYARGNTDSRLISFILSQKYYLPSEPTYIHQFIPTQLFVMG